MNNKDIFLKDMTWPEIEKRLKETDTVLVPSGQTEQHGHHLSIDTDNIICTGLAKRVAIKTFEDSKPVVAPTIPFGYSDIPYFRTYPGVFSLEPETLINVYKDVCKSLIKMGFKKIIFINGHAPNPPFIEEAFRQVTKETGAFCALCNFFVIPAKEVEKIFKEMGKTPVWGHACLIETSVYEAFGAEVRKNKVLSQIPTPFPKELQEFLPASHLGISIPSFEYFDTARSYWPEGSPGPKGDPTGYSKEIGERVIKATVDPIIKLINSIKTLKVNINNDFLVKYKDK